MNIRITRKTENAILPRKATRGAAAYDVYTPEDSLVRYGRNVIGLALAIEVPDGYEAKIEPRSGFSAKGIEDHHGERHDADVIQGKIDSDYRGEIGVIVYSRDRVPFTIRKGTRIAQLTFYKVEAAQWEETDILTETERGDGGFGSTGKF